MLTPNPFGILSNVFFLKLQLEIAEIWHTETSGGGFFSLKSQGFCCFFLGGGEIFWDEKKPNILKQIDVWNTGCLR